MDWAKWTLLAIAAAGPRGLTPVQLQKTLFVLGEFFPKEVGDNYYGFIPHYYGPFCQGIYSDAEQYAEQGLVLISSRSRTKNRIYKITAEGVTEAEEVEKDAPEDALGYLKEFVSWVQEMSFQDLLRAIYDKFPQYKEHSVFRF